MDFAGAEKTNKVLARTKAGAFAFFVLAGVLLMASLLMPPSAQPLPEAGQALAASAR